jgi:hypothetical protein
MTISGFTIRRTADKYYFPSSDYIYNPKPGNTADFVMKE